MACAGLYVVILPPIANGKRQAVLIKCLSDWAMAGKPRGEELKQWKMTAKLDQRRVDVEEVMDDHGNKKVVFWMKIEFHRRMGVREDSPGLKWGTFK